MFFVGALHTARQVQLEASVTLAAVVDIANDSREPRLIGAGVEDRMKMPIQPSPSGDVVVSPKFTDILAQHCRAGARRTRNWQRPQLHCAQRKGPEGLACRV